MRIIHAERYGDVVIECDREEMETIMMAFRRAPHLHGEDKVRMSLPVWDHTLHFETDKWW